MVERKNNDPGFIRGPGIGMRNYFKTIPRIYWRASLEPAAAVIAAPIAYINVVVVKKLVVGYWQIKSGLRARITAL